MNPEEIVHAYLNAIETRDFSLARHFLANRGFSYRSPVFDFDNADAFIAAISGVGPILERIDRRRTFVADNEVCSILTFVTSWSTPRSTDVVQWVTVEDDKIVAMETFFDGRAYREMFIAD
jgi:hypothetical protein